jgi:uncharacterized membrane protein
MAADDSRDKALPRTLPGFESVRRYRNAAGTATARILPGEYYVTREDEVIDTVLGSCVAACIRNPRFGIGGMNHFMLPRPGGSGADSWEKIAGRGMRYVIAGTAIAASLPGIVLFSLGAWPIVGFLGLDVLLVWWALSASLRDGKRREKLTLWPDQLELSRVSGRGKEELVRFNPLFVKLVIVRDYNERTTALHLRTRDSDTEIGAFLNADDKASFARAFGTALKKARQAA